VALIPAGTRGFDALGDPASPAQLVADGWVFRTFYIAQSSSYSTKITDATRHLAPARIRRHLDAGLAVLLNYERNADRWLGGMTAGDIDGRWSRQLAVELGYPTDCPILVSFDTDVSATTLPVARAYGEAFAAACRPWPVGVYGERSIIKALSNVLGWLPMATAWSTSPSAPDAVVHWRQRRPTAAETVLMPYATAQALDVNVAALEFPAWSTVAHAAPDTLEVPMLQFDYNGMILAYDGVVVRRVVSGRVANLTGIKPVDRQVVLDLVNECAVFGPSPFSGIAGHEDGELNNAWNSRPKAHAPVTASGPTSYSGHMTLTAS
jgi:hypothetical protein